MDTQQPRPRIPNTQFRVLILGKYNGGKTSILQRIRDTTDSHIIYRGGEETDLTADQCTLDPSIDRGEHIDDELVFSNHMGYIFHNSLGIGSGTVEELCILQEFIRRKCGERRLADRLHAIWF
ncbi:hypothetical protein EDB84DRAFT_1278740 [Lactarius hengduanensis]|nr:hypothetical protein EDB84DRAFT_1278740 [Lactarius hengduanensis]